MIGISVKLPLLPPLSLILSPCVCVFSRLCKVNVFSFLLSVLSKYCMWMKWPTQRYHCTPPLLYVITSWSQCWYFPNVNQILIQWCVYIRFVCSFGLSNNTYCVAFNAQQAAQLFLFFRSPVHEMRQASLKEQLLCLCLVRSLKCPLKFVLKAGSPPISPTFTPWHHTFFLLLMFNFIRRLLYC